MRKQPDSKNIKALALDLDGTTLMPDSSLGGRTLRALKACMDRDIQIIICTGRSAESAEPFCRTIGAEGPMVFFNGAEVMDMPAGKILSASLLDIEAVNFCIDISRSRGVYFQVYFPGPDYPRNPKVTLAAERQCAETGIYLNRTGVQAEITDLREAAARNPRGCVKCMFLGEPEVLETIQSKVTGSFGSRVFVTRSSRIFLEILNPEASKGTALRRVMALRGLGPGQVIAAGDDENDLSMFSAAGFSVAPSSAKEPVRNAADRVIGSCAGEGLAEFLEELFTL